MKRFWKTSKLVPHETGSWSILLDERPVRTPARAPLIVPGEALARAIAQEWDEQSEDIAPHTMPMTGFSNATIDRVLPALGDFRGQIAAYGQSDLLCYRADQPDSLIALQEAEWGPLLNSASARHGVNFNVTRGIVPVDQPALTLAALRGEVEMLDPWLLAGVATITQIGGTLVGTLAHLHDELDADALFDVASLDERWQAEKWGEDEQASALLAIKRAEFLQAARYCALVRAG